MRRVLLWIWESTFGPNIRQVEAEATKFRLSPAGQDLDFKTIVVLIATAGCLTLQHFASYPTDVQPVVGFMVRQIDGVEAEAEAREYLAELAKNQLSRLTWWACTAYTSYVLIPLMLIVLVLREKPTNYGLKLRGWYHGWKIYLVFVAVMVPLVWQFSAEERFQRSYPFYHVNSDTDVGLELICWEALYALQFVALEFFFRGFVVHGTKHRFGAYSAFVMTVPYCMIHFGKPMPECVASIIAGVALGLMSLATRSVWLGAALHVSVAWGMDICALSRRGLLDI